MRPAVTERPQSSIVTYPAGENKISERRGPLQCLPVKRWRSLILLTVACAFAATLYGFGAGVFSWRSVYEGSGREPLIQASRLFVYVALGILLAFRGGWPGVAAAVVMALAATSAEWALFPLSYGWAALGNEDAYAREFGEVARPPYVAWISYDLFAVAISSALAQGLRMMAGVNPRGFGDG